jgi:hypothetical protein
MGNEHEFGIIEVRGPPRGQLFMFIVLLVAFTTMAAEMRHTYSRDPSPPTIELRKTIR